MADIKNIVEEIKKLSLVEVSELVKALEEDAESQTSIIYNLRTIIRL